jgi:hypothetical protein
MASGLMQVAVCQAASRSVQQGVCQCIGGWASQHVSASVHEAASALGQGCLPL